MLKGENADIVEHIFQHFENSVLEFLATLKLSIPAHHVWRAVCNLCLKTLVHKGNTFGDV